MTNLQRRLSEVDPMASVVMQPLPDTAVTALAQEIFVQTTAPTVPAVPTKRRRRHLATGLLAAGVVAVPGVAFAALGGMHSGFFGTGGEEVKGEEKLYSDAPEIRGVVADLTKEFALPAGRSYDRLLSRYPTSERTLVQRTGLGQEVSLYAACAWYTHWQAGSAATRAQDQATLDAIPSWTYWRIAPSADPSPFTQIADQARHGDATTLNQFVTTSC
jgi:hypothetical protein